MPFAARITDNHVCPASSGPVPHGGGPIIPPASLNVLTNNLNQARVTDKAVCVGPPDMIVTGSSSVFVNGLMAARVTDKTVHGGTIVLGSVNVIIGGPAAGIKIGNPVAAAKACTALGTDPTAGRASGSSQQSYQNCGVESCRLLITKNGKSISEDRLLNQSIAHGDADSERRRADSGGTSPSQRKDILARNGVSTSEQDANMVNIGQAVAEGRGVITSHDVKILWGGTATGGHAVNVTGIEYDGNGNVVNVTTADTGVGQCQRVVPGPQFVRSLRPGRPEHHG